jgi:hypothetical protein
MVDVRFIMDDVEIHDVGPVARLSIKKEVGETINKAWNATQAFYADDKNVNAEDIAKVFQRLSNGFSTLLFEEDEEDYKVVYDMILAKNKILVTPRVFGVKKKKGEED